MDIVDRMFELADSKFKEQKDFAAAIPVHPTRVSEWRLRKSSSFQRRLPQIAKALDTTTEYLLTGEGPKTNIIIEIPSKAKKKELTPAKEGESRDPLDARIMDLASSLSPAQKKALIEKMEFLISMQ